MVMRMIRRWHDRERARLRAALNAPDTTQWENLGLWSHAGQSYADAARALALKVADSAALGSSHSVLDIGPGQSDEQRTLWQSQFAIGEYYPWERASAAPPVRQWDHVLAVDSAYFVPALWSTLETLWPRVKPGGSITWTDLYLKAPVSGAGTRLRLWATGRLSGIPHDHWRTLDVWARRVETLTQHPAHIEDLTDDVLGGFVRHMAQRRSDPPNPGLRLAHGTARLLAPLLETGTVGYGLFRMRRA
ncbi:MAG: hypothetical protein AAFU65_04285 [Pseudomonadota bacterium]